MASTYKIVRFYADENIRTHTVDVGLSLEEAQAHCSKESTHKVQIIEKSDGERYESVVWFDGYTKE